MNHAGGCQCGAVRFQTRNQPVRVIACHCGTCKQRTGSAFDRVAARGRSAAFCRGLAEEDEPAPLADRAVAGGADHVGTAGHDE